jgi:hypothetical protein
MPSKLHVATSSHGATTTEVVTATAAPATELRTLYPASQPFKTGNLAVSDLHTIYYEGW